MARIQVAIFGLQQSQQECLSFFSECVKYWEKLLRHAHCGEVRDVPETGSGEVGSSAEQGAAWNTLFPE
jgi:hypothetical protein